MWSDWVQKSLVSPASWFPFKVPFCEFHPYNPVWFQSYPSLPSYSPSITLSNSRVLTSYVQGPRFNRQCHKEMKKKKKTLAHHSSSLLCASLLLTGSLNSAVDRLLLNIRIQQAITVKEDVWAGREVQRLSWLRHSRAMQGTLETHEKSLQSVSLPTVFTS